MLNPNPQNRHPELQNSKLLAGYALGAIIGKNESALRQRERQNPATRALPAKLESMPVPCARAKFKQVQ